MGTVFVVALVAFAWLATGFPAEGKPLCPPQSPLNPRCAAGPTGAFDAKGDLWLTWVQDHRVRVARSEDKGRTFISVVTVHPDDQVIDAHGDGRPKIAIGRDNAVFVTWTERLGKPYTGHIRFARSFDGGKSFETPLIVNENREEIGHRFDALTVFPDGRVLVAWLDKRDVGPARQAGRGYEGAAVYTAISSDNGASFAANTKVADESCECCRIALAFGPDGRLAMLWRHVFPGSIRDHALSVFGSDGVWSAPQRVSFDNWELKGCPHHGPAMTIAANGFWHMAWFNDGRDGKGLSYVRSTDGGRTFDPPVRFGDYLKWASHPALLSKERQLWLAWLEFGGERHQLMLMRSTDGGMTWGKPRAVADSTHGDHPQLLDDGRAIYVSWGTHDDGWRLIPVGGDE